ncbi:hypothetical protein NECID01_1382 [Nematocida sp. AWRm77]|nr:hypothetical protein NECID01_1382 [Nematocida sp. AWRm77]
MNTESIKLLADADRKASDIVKEAREERTRLKIEAHKRGEEHEQTLLEKKCQEIKQFREETSNNLLELEKKTQQHVSDILQKIQENKAHTKTIVEALTKLVVDEK